MKAATLAERRNSRVEYKEKGITFLRDGNTSAARECFQKAIDITSEMVLKVIHLLQAENIQYIVAPYEADAQLAFLSLGKFVDCVITEDSDLIAYGCSRVNPWGAAMC